MLIFRIAKLSQIARSHAEPRNLEDFWSETRNSKLISDPFLHLKISRWALDHKNWEKGKSNWQATCHLSNFFRLSLLSHAHSLKLILRLRVLTICQDPFYRLVLTISEIPSEVPIDQGTRWLIPASEILHRVTLKMYRWRLSQKHQRKVKKHASL